MTRFTIPLDHITKFVRIFSEFECVSKDNMTFYFAASPAAEKPCARIRLNNKKPWFQLNGRRKRSLADWNVRLLDTYVELPTVRYQRQQWRHKKKSVVTLDTEIQFFRPRGLWRNFSCLPPEPDARLDFAIVEVSRKSMWWAKDLLPRYARLFSEDKLRAALKLLAT